MPIPLSALRRESLSASATLAKAVRTRKADQKTAFLCHSHLDADYVAGLLVMFHDNGLDIYVDWQDTTLPDKPNRATAAKIQRRIEAADYFLFLATPNAMASRWCPWEIGYADGVRDIETIFLITTLSHGQAFGSEYLELYQSIDLSDRGDLGIWPPGTSGGGRPILQL